MPVAGEDQATVVLWEAGTLGIEVQDTDASTLWLTAFFTDRPGLADELATALSTVRGVVAPTPVAEIDWVARFREGFRPISVGDFRIVPAWDADGSPDTRRLVVDPGRAFGTGTHESTRLCLVALQRIATRSSIGRVADIGTGTGLLALAAFRLGGSPVVGVDIDPEAISSARHHAHLNRVPLMLVQGDGTQPLAAGAFDLVLANLTLTLLIERRTEISSLLAPGGHLVLAGFLGRDLRSLRECYSPVGSHCVLTDGEWAAIMTTTGKAA